MFFIGIEVLFGARLLYFGSVLLALSNKILKITVPSEISSSTPVTVTVLSLFQLDGIIDKLDGYTVPCV